MARLTVPHGGLPVEVTRDAEWLTYTAELDVVPGTKGSLVEEFAGAELSRVTRERDLYRRLLDLGDQEDLDHFVESALKLVIEATGANQGYLELRDIDRDDNQFWS